ncbi:MAG: hypothetical protein HY975_03855, partial [Candidatus Kerfeldbacteria bacterium]|nr:hypothetical protein [Candidatus Kerfeldbacteria bacterium]
MIYINLLPPSDKQLISTERMFMRWQRALLWTMVATLIITGGLAAGRWMLDRENQTVHQRLADVQQRQSQDSSSDITTLTGKLNTTI